MRGTVRCYDNARMDRFFATLKMEKLYRMDTTTMEADEVVFIIVCYLAYYNLRRVYIPKGSYLPAIFRG